MEIVMRGRGDIIEDIESDLIDLIWKSLFFERFENQREQTR